MVEFNDFLSPNNALDGTPVDPNGPSGSLVDLATEVAGILNAANIDPAMATDAELNAALLQYQLRSEKGVANGYASLDGSARVPLAQLPTTFPPGIHVSTHQQGGTDQLNVSGLSGLLGDPQTPAQHGIGSGFHSPGTLGELNSLLTDANLDDVSGSRTPTGAAAGDLVGSYPSPTVRVGFPRRVVYEESLGITSLSGTTLQLIKVSADLGNILAANEGAYRVFAGCQFQKLSGSGQASCSLVRRANSSFTSLGQASIPVNGLPTFFSVPGRETSFLNGDVDAGLDLQIGNNSAAVSSIFFRAFVAVYYLGGTV